MLQGQTTPMSPANPGEFKIRQKSTGLFWVNDRWDKLAGNFYESEVHDLDDDRELVSLIPIISETRGHARGIITLQGSGSGTVYVRAGQVWRQRKADDRREFRCEVTGNFPSGHPIPLVAAYPGSWGNLGAGVLLLSDTGSGHVVAPGFFGGHGRLPDKQLTDTEQAETEKVLRKYLKNASGTSAEEKTEAQAKLTCPVVGYADENNPLKSRDWPSLGHPVTGETLVLGTIYKETGVQKLRSANGVIETAIGGAGLIRGKFETASGSTVEGYLNGGNWLWTDITTTLR